MGFFLTFILELPHVYVKFIKLNKLCVFHKQCRFYSSNLDRSYVPISTDFNGVSGQDSNENNDDSDRLYSLTWTLRFPYDSDTCYLAHCYPYTYSRLQYYLKQITSNPAVASYCEVRTLCQSLAGNAVYVITITSRGTSQEEVRNKKAVVVTARVHPGETNGSWMMEGFLDFLLGDSDDAQVLRDNFVFKVRN